MKKITTTLFLISFIVIAACAQHKVNIIIEKYPAFTGDGPLYLAGDFNNWEPAHERSKLIKLADGRYAFRSDNVPGGDYQFKVTRGSWETVESGPTGQPIANRQLSIVSDTTVVLAVEGWGDAFGTRKKPVATSSSQVRVIDTAFFMPQLGRTRRVWVYLPKDYQDSKRKYPVLYMHDGQNLFDDLTSYAGEWGVDEALDSLNKGFIVVGIDNGQGKRMNEYNPNDNPRFGKGEGAEYLAFIVKTLKPYIDKHYRTSRKPEHTAIAGSSMGGLISFYAGLWYPGVFGKVGVFSPSFWISPAVEKELDEASLDRKKRYQQYYFFAGGKEGGNMVPDMERVVGVMKAKGLYDLSAIVDPNGMHNESTWRKQMPGFIDWLKFGVR